jgi:5-methylcytosine-specific restriction endonuclease McrA
MANGRNSFDERLKRWLAWYDKQNSRRDQLARCDLPAKALARLTRAELVELYSQRLRDGWSAPNRRRHQAVQGYRDLVISLLVQRDGDLCGLCGKPTPPDDRTIDHVIQKKDGGSDTAENVRLAHGKCNRLRPRKEEKWQAMQREGRPLQ